LNKFLVLSVHVEPLAQLAHKVLKAIRETKANVVKKVKLVPKVIWDPMDCVEKKVRRATKANKVTLVLKAFLVSLDLKG
jgi:hypothetical protein